MSRPQAYAPQQGYKFQLLVKTPYDSAYEHCDYAKDRIELKYLISNYKEAYGAGYTFKPIMLPRKYWND